MAIESRYTLYTDRLNEALTIPLWSTLYLVTDFGPLHLTLCFLSSVRVAKSFWQKSQEYGRTLICTLLIWILKDADCINFLSQRLQANEGSTWVNWWVLSDKLVVKALSQYLHSKGVSSLWRLVIWSFKLVADDKPIPQIVQMQRIPPVACLFICFL